MAIRPLTNMPSVTAGLMWQPEIGPTANAMASKERPNAMATPTLPTFAPAITAVVSPAKTRTKVPNNSAAYFIRLSPRELSFPTDRTSSDPPGALPQCILIADECQRNSTWGPVFWHVSVQMPKATGLPRGRQAEYPRVY